MVGRNAARYLAPIALAAAVGGTYLIVSHHVGGSSSKHAAAHPQQQTHRSRGRLARARFYTVQAGDSLTQIAAKTRIPITTLEQMNPSLNPDSLQTGQRIRLRR